MHKALMDFKSVECCHCQKLPFSSADHFDMGRFNNIRRSTNAQPRGIPEFAQDSIWHQRNELTHHQLLDIGIEQVNGAHELICEDFEGKENESCIKSCVLPSSYNPLSHKKKQKRRKELGRDLRGWVGPSSLTGKTKLLFFLLLTTLLRKKKKHFCFALTRGGRSWGGTCVGGWDPALSHY